MKIQCKNCGFTETTNKELFVKVLGAAMPAFGFFAWTSFLFAGTGFAMVICIAIIAGGPALLMYKDEIVQWLASKGYKCPKCGHEHWVAMGDHVDSSQSKEFEQQKTSVSVRSANVEESNTQAEHVKKPRIKVIDISAPFILNSQEITDHHLAKELKELGSVNNGAAENKLADMYYNGLYVKRNYQKAFYWANIAAQKGSRNSQILLNVLYRNGQGVDYDESMAYFWFKQSQQNNIGLENSERNKLKNQVILDLKNENFFDSDQIKEINVLAQNDNGDAENRIGQIYYAGINTNQNYSKAFKWTLISAEKGNKDAQFRLSNLYRNGWGEVRNEELASFWLNKSKEK